jgi:hypothetical protein
MTIIDQFNSKELTMTNEITYAVKPISEISDALMLDLNVPANCTHGIVRTSAISEKVWGFYMSRSLAVAACRRWRSRDIVTR